MTRTCAPGVRVAACCEAAEDAPPPPAVLRGTPPDDRRTNAHQPAFKCKHAAAAQRYHQAAVVDEVLDLAESFVADAASDVIGFCRRAETRRLQAFS